MEKHSITVFSEADACFMNGMIEQMVSKKIFRKEFVGFDLLDVEGYPLHVGVNYTSDQLVQRCVNENGEGVRIQIEPTGVWQVPFVQRDRRVYDRPNRPTLNLHFVFDEQRTCINRN